MTCARRPVVLVEIKEGIDSDPVGGVTGTWMIKGALPVFEPGDVTWPEDKPVHAGSTPSGRSFRASSPYVRDWEPDRTFAASLDRALDAHFASV